MGIGTADGGTSVVPLSILPPPIDSIFWPRTLSSYRTSFQDWQLSSSAHFSSLLVYASAIFACIVCLARRTSSPCCLSSVLSALLLGEALPNPLIIAADSQAILWFICTAAAFVTARNRHIVQHRVWMIRSYSVTLVFFTSRVLLPIPAYGNMGPTGIATSLFLCSFPPS